jgi:hypothetical protein
MPSRAIRLARQIGALALALGALSSACRGRLPPTEPRSGINDGPPRALEPTLASPPATGTSSLGTNDRSDLPAGTGGGDTREPAGSRVP